MPKRYLVTGGCGFIGSHLVDGLIATGHAIVILDNLSTGKKEHAPAAASLIIGDATDYRTVENAFASIDGCFHLAAIASVERSALDWAGTHRVNVTAAVNVFQTASRCNPKVPVVYASSAAVYGDCGTIPLSETAPALPLTAYGVDKLGCELHGRVAWGMHGVPTIGLRPFNVYGTRQDPSSPYSGVISIFIDRIRRGKPLTIHGDGKQVRDFVYVKDAVQGFMAAMDILQQPEHTMNHEVINLCTGRPTSVNELADSIAAIAGRTVQREYAPRRRGDIRISIGDPARLAERLGLRLNTSLHEGLRVLMNDGK